MNFSLLFLFAILCLFSQEPAEAFSLFSNKECTSAGTLLDSEINKCSTLTNELKLAETAMQQTKDFPNSNFTFETTQNNPSCTVAAEIQDSLVSLLKLEVKRQSILKSLQEKVGSAPTEGALASIREIRKLFVTLNSCEACQDANCSGLCADKELTLHDLAERVRKQTKWAVKDQKEIQKLLTESEKDWIALDARWQSLQKTLEEQRITYSAELDKLRLLRDSIHSKIYCGKPQHVDGAPAEDRPFSFLPAAIFEPLRDAKNKLYFSNPKIEQRVRNSVKLVANDNLAHEVGSGFSVHVGEKIIFITAYHAVYGAELPTSYNQNYPVLVHDARPIPLSGPDEIASFFLGQFATWSINFQVRPNQLDRTNDIALHEVPSAPALELAEAKRPPVLGQEFIMIGHPGVEGAAYGNRRCYFLGYGESLFNGDLAYLVQCPENNGNQGGFSGGPLVDPATGKVYGINSAHAYIVNDQPSSTKKMLITPISLSKNGTLYMGPLNRLKSNLCYEKSDHYSKPKPCTIYNKYLQTSEN